MKILALAAIGGLALAGVASAAPLNIPSQPSVQQADWYCGPECQRHRYWQHRRWERQQQSQYYHYQQPYHQYQPQYYGYRGY